MRVVFALTHYLISDENLQVNGFVFFSDMSKFSLKHQTFYGMDVMKNSTRCFEVGVHLVNPLYYGLGKLKKTVEIVLPNASTETVLYYTLSRYSDAACLFP